MLWTLNPGSSKKVKVIFVVVSKDQSSIPCTYREAHNHHIISSFLSGSWLMKQDWLSVTEPRVKYIFSSPCIKSLWLNIVCCSRRFYCLIQGWWCRALPSSQLCHHHRCPPPQGGTAQCMLLGARGMMVREVYGDVTLQGMHSACGWMWLEALILLKR